MSIEIGRSRRQVMFVYMCMYVHRTSLFFDVCLFVSTYTNMCTNVCRCI